MSVLEKRKRIALLMVDLFTFPCHCPSHSSFPSSFLVGAALSPALTYTPAPTSPVFWLLSLLPPFTGTWNRDLGILHGLPGRARLWNRL